MSTKAKKDLSILIFLHSNFDSYTKTIEAARCVLQRKLFQRPHDMIQLINIACDKLVDLRPLDTINLKHLDILDEFQADVEKENGNNKVNEVKLSFALRVGLKIMKDAINEVGGINSFQIIIYTQFQDVIFSEETVNHILNEWDPSVRLYICSPNISLDLDVYASKDKDIEQAVKKLDLPTQVHRLLIESKGLACNLEMSKHLIEAYKPVVKLPVGWYASLSIAPDLEIPVVGYRYTMNYAEPKWTLKTKTENNESADKKHVFLEKSYAANVGMYANNKWKDNNTQDKKLENVIKEKYLTSSGKVAYLSYDEKKAHKPPTVRCLDVLFTMSPMDLNELYNVGTSTTLLYPDLKKSKSNIAFQSFREALQKENLVAIARKCYNKNNFPKLFAIVPHGIACLKLFQVPYKNYTLDKMLFYPNSLGLWKSPMDCENEKQLDSTHKSVIYDYLSSLELHQGDDPNFVPVQLTSNPKLDSLYNTIIKYEDSKRDSEDIDIKLEDLDDILQPKILRERAAEALLKLESVLN